MTRRPVPHPVPRRSRSVSLSATDVVAAVERAAALHAQLAADGFALAPRCEGHIRQNMDIAWRLVWRKRAAGEAVTMIVVSPAALIDGRLIINLNYVLEWNEVWSLSQVIQPAAAQ